MISPFLMPIEDVFSISGRGTVVTGRVERGCEGWRRDRDRWHRTREDDAARALRCSASCSIRAKLATTLVCCFVASKREEVERGQVLAQPGSITPHTTFQVRSAIF